MKNKCTTLLIIILGIIFFNSCNPALKFYGTVKDDTGKELTDVDVTIKNFNDDTEVVGRDVTKEGGEYSIDVEGMGKFKVIAEKSGYRGDSVITDNITDENEKIETPFTLIAPILDASINEYEILSPNEDYMEFTLTSNLNWTASGNDWLTCDPISGNGDETIKVNWTENTDPTSGGRTGEILLKSKYTNDKTITFTQPAAELSAISLSDEFKSLQNNEVICEIFVSSNITWNAVITSNSDNLITSISHSTGTGTDFKFTVICSQNPTVNLRTAKVTFSGEGVTKELTITQFGQNPSIRLNVPNGSETWYIGKTNTINWSDNILENVVVELWKGSNFETLTSEPDPTESYQWLIPLSKLQGNDYKIRVKSATNSTLADYSDSYFTLSYPVITVTNFTTIVAGVQQTISWTVNPTISDNFIVQLYNNNTQIGENIPNTSLSQCTWTPNLSLSPASTYRIKVMSSTNPEIFDFTEYFTIATPTINITTPTTWYTKYQYDINWSYPITTDYVKIELLKGGVVQTTTIPSSTQNTGTYSNFTVPETLVNGNDYKIRISSTTQPAITNTSSTFTINQTSLTFYSPLVNTVYYKTQPNTISWNDNITEAVKIDLYKGGSFVSNLTSSTPSNGSFNWTPLNTLLEGTDYTIKITSTTNSNVWFESAAFSVLIFPVITVTSPISTTVLEKGTQPTITWTYNITDNVKVELFKTGNSTAVSLITASTSANSISTWTVPTTLTIAGDYYIKVTSIANSSISDVSENFWIKPYLSTGLIAYYPFNGNVNDESGNGNNGINYSVGFTSGKIGQCGSFGDNKWVDIPTLPLLTQNGTIFFWANDGGSSGNGLKCLYSTYNTNQFPILTFWICGTPYAGGYYVHIEFKGAGGTGDWIWEWRVDGGVFNPFANAWHSYALVQNGSQINLFIDGTSLGFSSGGSDAGAWLGDKFTENDKTHLGKDFSTSSDYYGQMDEVRFYNSALTSQEIQNLHNLTY